VAGGRVRVVLSTSAVFSPNELTVTPHFLVSRQNANGEGRYFPIVSQAGTSVEISAQFTDLGGLTTGGAISVIPAWTLDSLLPPGSQTALHPSSGRLGDDRKSELLFFDTASIGTKLAPARRFFVTSQGWFDSRTFAAAGNEVITPGQAFIIRHPANLAATEFIPSQQIFGGVVAQSVRVSQGREQDTVVSFPRPLPTLLPDLGLDAQVFEESEGTSQGTRKDQIVFFDNLSSGYNKAPAAVYFKEGGQWRQDGAGFPLANQVEVKPGQPFVIRRAPGGATSRVFWSNSPAYDLSAP
jgi:uncharacterized protein (TIGR02597 family)